MGISAGCCQRSVGPATKADGLPGLAKPTPSAPRRRYTLHEKVSPIAGRGGIGGAFVEAAGLLEQVLVARLRLHSMNGEIMDAVIRLPCS